MKGKWRRKKESSKTQLAPSVLVTDAWITWDNGTRELEAARKFLRTALNTEIQRTSPRWVRSPFWPVYLLIFQLILKLGRDTPQRHSCTFGLSRRRFRGLLSSWLFLWRMRVWGLYSLARTGLTVLTGAAWEPSGSIWMPNRLSVRIKWNNICKLPIRWERVNTLYFFCLHLLPESLPFTVFQSPWFSMGHLCPGGLNLFSAFRMTADCSPSLPHKMLSTPFSVTLLGYIWSQVFFSGKTSLVLSIWSSICSFYRIAWHPIMYSFVMLSKYFYLRVSSVPDNFVRKRSALL